jgi:hypothetical protein
MKLYLYLYKYKSSCKVRYSFYYNPIDNTYLVDGTVNDTVKQTSSIIIIIIIITSQEVQIESNRIEIEVNRS